MKSILIFIIVIQSGAVTVPKEWRRDSQADE